MSLELLLAASGAILLLVAASWRGLHRHRVGARLADALRDPDPVRRRAAIGVATEQGLRPHAATLVARIDEETDPHVRAALVEGVLRNAWEPADQPSILRLRLWAHEERARWLAAPRPRTPVTARPTPAPSPVPRPALPRRRLERDRAVRATRPSPHPLQVRTPDQRARHRADTEGTRMPVAEGHR